MTPRDRERYARQIVLPHWGETGQQRLMEARVAIVGCGALGSFQAGALLRAGARRLVLIDRDYVEHSNLQRQWLYTEADADEALPKAAAAAQALRRIDSSSEALASAADLTADNIDEVLDGVSLILDGTDNFETRYLINDWAVSRCVPWIYGAAVGRYGLTMPVIPGQTACLACVYPAPPEGAQPTCETAGVLNVITSLIASLQVAEAQRWLTEGRMNALLTTVDLDSGRLRSAAQPMRDPQCRACGQRRFTYLEGRSQKPVSLCGRNAVQIHDRRRNIDLVELEQRLAPLGEVRANPFALRFRVAPYELTVFPDGRAIVKGTEEIGLARSLYARYVGV